MAIAVCHELGHILFQRRFFDRHRSFSKITDEATAWEVAFMIADKFLRSLNVYNNAKLKKYAMKCLGDYLKNYDEMKIADFSIVKWNRCSEVKPKEGGCYIIRFKGDNRVYRGYTFDGDITLPNAEFWAEDFFFKS